MIAEVGKNTLFLCMQCGTCSASCVSKSSFNLRRLVFESFSKNRDFKDPDLWDCTTCHNCQSRCPRGIPLTEMIINSRKEFVEEGFVPPEIRNYLNSIQKFRNPFGQPKHRRVEWASDLDLKILDSSDTEFEWLWFVGCLSSYDARAQEVARKTARIFNEIGLNFAILGNKEGCCGNDALALGEEGLFELLKEENESIFEEYGVKKLITSSPHCYNIFKNYYGIETVSALEIVHRAIKEGTLAFKHDVEARITYHDPCYLGRYNGIYDIPREVLKSIYNIEFVEMRRIRENSFCCGGGSGNFMRESKSRANVSRAREAVQTGADILAVSCPICLNMLEDGVKSINADIEVMDIMEIVHLAMFGE